MLEHVPPLLRPKSLWVHPRFRLNRKIDLKYLSNIFIELIKDTRIFNDLNPEIPIGPHQTKKLSASYSLQIGQDLEKVRKTMGFSTIRIMLKNYVAWVPQLEIYCATRWYLDSTKELIELFIIVH